MGYLICYDQEAGGGRSSCCCYPFEDDPSLLCAVLPRGKWLSDWIYLGHDGRIVLVAAFLGRSSIFAKRMSPSHSCLKGCRMRRWNKGMLRYLIHSVTYIHPKGTFAPARFQQPRLLAVTAPSLARIWVGSRDLTVLEGDADADLEFQVERA